MKLKQIPVNTITDSKRNLVAVEFSDTINDVLDLLEKESISSIAVYGKYAFIFKSLLQESCKTHSFYL